MKISFDERLVNSLKPRGKKHYCEVLNLEVKLINSKIYDNSI